MPSQPVPEAGFRAANLAHRLLLRVTGGRVAGRLMGMPVIELTVVGRRSGAERTVILTVPVLEQDRLVVVASKGGAEQHPQWYRNLLADPDVWVTRAGRRRPMKARTASAAERERLWPQCVRAYPGYGQYQRRTGREIPLVILEPR